MRLHAIRIYTESNDPFFDSVPINLWSMVEVNVGILCASIPSLKALFSKGQRERSKTSTGTGGYMYHSRGKSGVQNTTGLENEVEDGNEAYGLVDVRKDDASAHGQANAEMSQENGIR